MYIEKLCKTITPKLLGSELLGVLFSVVLVFCVIVIVGYLIKIVFITDKKKLFEERVSEQRHDTHVACHTVVGTRQYQQDSVCVDTLQINGRKEYVAAVFDGMGGMDDGEKASRLCAELFPKAIGEVDKWNSMPKFFTKFISALDDKVSSFCDAQGNALESGTTIVAAAVSENELYWASAGDSRIYLFSNGSLSCLTRDHNYALSLKHMVERGEITQERANQEERPDALISYIGIGGISIIDVNSRPVSLSKGDIVMLCSDGVCKLINDEYIEEVIMKNKSKSPISVARAIIDETCLRRVKSQDNTTVAIIKC